MGSTMVQLITECTQELGIPTPTTVAGNNSQDIVQLLALMNACGYELLRRADWRELTKQHTFYTEATTTTGTWTTRDLVRAPAPDLCPARILVSWHRLVRRVRACSLA